MPALAFRSRCGSCCCARRLLLDQLDAEVWSGSSTRSATTAASS
jgi:hypothetical protein